MLHDIVRHTYDLEQELEKVNTEYAIEHDKWLEEHSDLINRKTELEVELKSSKDEIKAETLRIYWETGNKKPHPAASIALYKVFKIDDREALAWCEVRAPFLIMKSVDRKMYERILADRDYEDMPGEIEKEPRVRMASNLGKALQDA